MMLTANRHFWLRISAIIRRGSWRPYAHTLRLPQGEFFSPGLANRVLWPPTKLNLRSRTAGFCHGDLHLIDNDLGISAYPLVPGHEVLGTITAMGEGAEGLAIGERVGAGEGAEEQNAVSNSTHQSRKRTALVPTISPEDRLLAAWKTTRKAKSNY